MWSFKYPDQLLHRTKEKEWFPPSKEEMKSRCVPMKTACLPMTFVVGRNADTVYAVASHAYFVSLFVGVQLRRT
jgi:hypothetical protein